MNGAQKESVGTAHPGLKAWATENKPLLKLGRYRRIASLILAAALLASAAAHAAQTAESRAESRAESLPYAVVVSGLGGDSTYEKLIQGWGKDLSSALRKNVGSDGRVFWLAAKKQEGVHAESTREEIRKLFDQLAARVRPHDVLELFLIGHGSYDDYDYRLSIPGPDLTASQWAELLARIPAERQAVVNMTSASGGSMAALQRKGRVVVTSTTAGRERNFSVFARYFVAALQDTAADTDKNQEISALEAFRYATREVTRYYESVKRLATEHPVLEDRGEGEGVRDPNPQNGIGMLAAALPLVRLGGQQSAADTPQARELRAKKRKLEEGIEQLKYGKASMDTEQYAQQLEKMLVELSVTQQQLDNLEKKAEPRP